MVNLYTSASASRVVSLPGISSKWNIAYKLGEPSLLPLLLLLFPLSLSHICNSYSVASSTSSPYSSTSIQPPLSHQFTPYTFPSHHLLNIYQCFLLYLLFLSFFHIFSHFFNSSSTSSFSSVYSLYLPYSSPVSSSMLPPLPLPSSSPYI